MFISEILKNKVLSFSFEVFPPKRNQPVESIYGTLDSLAALKPDYISVTYGAGGSQDQQEITCQIAARLKHNCKIEPLAHLTCVNSNRSQVDSMLKILKVADIQNVLALRGDRVLDIPSATDFLYASQLIAHIHRIGGFDIAAACYPEGHPDSDSVEQDIAFAKEKVAQGASHLVSQLFFDNQDFYRMLELAQKLNIHVPIQAGIMPVVNAKQIERMVSLCGAKLPPKFSKIIARYGDNPKAMYDAGVCYATEQIVDLIASGVSGIHLYTMNNPLIAQDIYHSIKNLLESANGVSS